MNINPIISKNVLLISGRRDGGRGGGLYLDPWLHSLFTDLFPMSEKFEYEPNEKVK